MLNLHCQYNYIQAITDEKAAEQKSQIQSIFMSNSDFVCKYIHLLHYATKMVFWSDSHGLQPSTHTLIHIAILQVTYSSN